MSSKYGCNTEAATPRVVNCQNYSRAILWNTEAIIIIIIATPFCYAPNFVFPRNPDHNQRPSFDSIHDYLESPEESLLQWNDRDIDPDRLAHVLGSPLEEANNLYLDLQRIYQKPLIQ